MFSIPEEVRVIRARNLAHRLHAGQSRKDGKPYHTHTSRVSALARAAELPLECVITAHLHDSREDQLERLAEEAARFYETALPQEPATRDALIDSMLAEHYHPAVPRLVWAMTDDPAWNGLHPRERKPLQVKKFRKGSDDIRALKLCDLTDNMRACELGPHSGIWDDEDEFYAYVEGNRRVASVCAGANQRLDTFFARSYEKVHRLYLS